MALTSLSPLGRLWSPLCSNLQPAPFCFHSRVSFSSGKYGNLSCSHPARFGCTAASAPVKSSVVQTESNPQVLVDSLLSLVEGTDCGVLLRDDERAKVEEVVVCLEQYCIPKPLESPLIFGEWDVVFTSNPTAAGGYYRSVIGRALLKTNEMIQTITPPDFVGNYVSFTALGLLNGKVSLKGKLQALDTQWIKITFDPPDLKLGSFEFKYGGTSTVKISIIYVDERIRLGRGSRGSIFVFKRRDQ